VPVLRLRSIGGGRHGQEFVFSGPRVRIGRSRDNDLILPERENPSSSSRHAEALLEASGEWCLIDVGSSNGTRINGTSISRQALKNGDRVAFGDELFVVGFGGWRRPWLYASVAAALVAAAGFITYGIVESRRTPFENVALSAAPSVFLIAIEDGGSRTLVGTSFVVGADGVLATNAHIAAELQRRGVLPGSDGRGGAGSARAVAIQGDTYVARRIVSVVIAPDWHAGSLRSDIALLRLEPGPALAPLRLADQAVVAGITRGMPIATFGFPAVSTDADKPRGRLSVDVVGDVRGEYLEVGLGIAPGTSGSPVFDGSGVVVGIVAGGDFVTGPDAPPRPTGSSANWALVATVLSDLRNQK
jgi:S1-C subfamily serine protease